MDTTRDTLLSLVQDVHNPLNVFDGKEHVLDHVISRVEKYHFNKAHVVSEPYTAYMTYACRDFQTVQFPEPRDIEINMMPFRPHDLDTVPKEYSKYIPLIRQCYIGNYEYNYAKIRGDPTAVVSVRDRVCYLTVHESLVRVGETQRRPGLHIERPGCIARGGRLAVGMEARDIVWGLGRSSPDGRMPVDGIYFASNLGGTSEVYPNLIEAPREVTDAHGGIEHLREFLGTPYRLKAGEMCWITDRTPHASLPVTAPADDPDAEFVYRQFFRVVVGKISVWYSKHNTANPLGVLPDAEIVDDDKFA